MGLEALTHELRGLTEQHETAALSLHQALAQKQRAAALVHTLTRHLEAGRATRRAKMERVEMTLAEQEARLKAYDEREKRRLNLSMMPRVRCVCGGVARARVLCCTLGCRSFLEARRAIWMKTARTG